MKTFMVTVEGRNVFFKDIDTNLIERYGFFATRLVAAKDENEASNEVLSLIDREIKGLIIPAKEIQNLPVFFVTKIQESSATVIHKKGFSFYKDPINN